MKKIKENQKAKQPTNAVAATEPAEQPVKRQPSGVVRYRVKGPELPEPVRSSGLMASSAVFNATAVMASLQKNLAGESATSDSVMLAVDEQVERVQAGDMSEVEAMLMSQAISLQTTYASLARKAAAQEYLKTYQVHMTLALKAQAQSRATLEALIELKHPRHPPTFVKQANIAHGPQQVNQYGATPANGEIRDQYAPAHAHTENGGTAPNKLLEASHENKGGIGFSRIPNDVDFGVPARADGLRTS